MFLPPCSVHAKGTFHTMSAYLLQIKVTPLPPGKLSNKIFHEVIWHTKSNCHLYRSISYSSDRRYVQKTEAEVSSFVAMEATKNDPCYLHQPFTTAGLMHRVFLHAQSIRSLMTLSTWCSAAVQWADYMPGRGGRTMWSVSQVEASCNGCQNRARHCLSLEMEHLVWVPFKYLI